MVTHLYVGFRVKDYEQWKAGYDASIKQRIASGETAFRVLRDVDDPNLVTVISEQADVAGVRAFMASPDLNARDHRYEPDVHNGSDGRRRA